MKTKILGKSVTVTSDIKMEELKELQKFNPEALLKKDKDGNVIYAIGVGTASISPYGASFDDKNAEGFAQLSFPINCKDEDKEKFVKDTFGNSIFNLMEMEETVIASLATLSSKITAIKEAITVVE